LDKDENYSPHKLSYYQDQDNILLIINYIKVQKLDLEH